MAAPARTTAIRKRLRELVMQLSEENLHAVQKYVEYLAAQEEHPAILALKNAPVRDDEPLTEEDRERIRKAKESVRAGRVVSFEAAWQELVEGERR